MTSETTTPETIAPETINPETITSETIKIPDFSQMLNSEQLDVVQNANGAALVIAGPGSGKTRTLVYRVARLILSDTAPENILLLTFTNKAAAEMKSRLEVLVGKKAQKITASTFHSFANMLLRRHASRIGSGIGADFTILDGQDSETLIKRIIRTEYPDSKSKKSSANNILSAIGLSKLCMCPIKDILSRSDFFHLMKQANDVVHLSEVYLRKKREMNALDFDDLLVELHGLLLKEENLREFYQNLYTHVLIDEYQDTDKLQAEILCLLYRKGNNILAVGDDCQSIYSFRGASIQNILSFEQKFGGKKFFLLSNYRSTACIVAFVNEIIKNGVEKIEKSLKPASEAGLGVFPLFFTAVNREEESLKLGKLIEADLAVGHSVGVLFRAAYLSSEMELYLMQKNIPYELWGGIKFFEQKHIKDILALLRSFVNPKDNTSVQRLFMLSNGIGEIIAERIATRIFIRQDLVEQVQQIKNGKESGKESNFSAAISSAFLAGQNSNAAGMINEFYAGFYKTYLKENFDDYVQRESDIDALLSIAVKYPNVTEFLYSLTLDPDVEAKKSITSTKSTSSTKSTRNVANVILSTIHQAKGREWDSVYIICVANGFIPFARSDNVEEERRLLYVAASRARKKLIMSMPLAMSRFGYGYQERLEPSLFIREIVDNASGNLEISELMD